MGVGLKIHAYFLIIPVRNALPGTSAFVALKAEISLKKQPVMRISLRGTRYDGKMHPHD
jgi:hypothetical protein